MADLKSRLLPQEGPFTEQERSDAVHLLQYRYEAELDQPEVVKLVRKSGAFDLLDNDEKARAAIVEVDPHASDFGEPPGKP